MEIRRAFGWCVAAYLLIAAACLVPRTAAASLSFIWPWQLTGDYARDYPVIQWAMERVEQILANEFITSSSGSADAGRAVLLDSAGHLDNTFISLDATEIPSHTHVKADVTDTPWAWSDVSKTGSSLADLATRSIDNLSDVNLVAVADGHILIYDSGAFKNSTKNAAGLSEIGHTHTKSDITDTPWAWSDVSKTGSSLADLETRGINNLSDVALSAQADKDVLMWVGANSRFENTTRDAAGLVTKSDAQTITGTKTFSSADIQFSSNKARLTSSGAGYLIVQGDTDLQLLSSDKVRITLGVADIVSIEPAGVTISADATLTSTNALNLRNGNTTLSSSGDGVLAFHASTNADFDCNVLVQTSKEIRFRDSGLYLYSPADGNLTVSADTSLDLAVGGTAEWRLQSDRLRSQGGFLNMGDKESVTISSDAATITKPYVELSGEGSAADDLKTITLSGATAGDIVILQATGSAGTITVKNKAVGGNINCGADRVLNSQVDKMVLMYNGSAWCQISYADNG